MYGFGDVRSRVTPRYTTVFRIELLLFVESFPGSVVLVLAG